MCTCNGKKINFLIYMKLKKNTSTLILCVKRATKFLKQFCRFDLLKDKFKGDMKVYFYEIYNINRSLQILYVNRSYGITFFGHAEKCLFERGMKIKGVSL